MSKLHPPPSCQQLPFPPGYHPAPFLGSPMPPPGPPPLEYTCFLPFPPPLPPPPPQRFFPPRPPYPGPTNQWRVHSKDRVQRGSYARKGDWRKGDFTCSSCHRSYKSEATYQEHVLSHVQCKHCDFSALPKLVRDHETVHSLPDFLKFTTPEEIKKWREERRRNYPTVANIVKKQQQAMERKERGQVANTPLYRYVNQLIGNSERGKGRGRGRGRGWYQRRGGGRGGEVGRRGQWMPRHKWKRYNQKRSEGEECEDMTKDNTAVLKGGENESLPDNEESQHKRQYSSPRGRWLSQRGRERGRGRGRGKGYHWSRRAGTKRDGDSTVTSAAKRYLTVHDVIPRNPTLLEKLLAAEIRREHNAVLQCVRHVVKEEFFGIGEKGGRLPGVEGEKENGQHSTACSDSPSKEEEGGRGGEWRTGGGGIDTIM